MNCLCAGMGRATPSRRLLLERHHHCRGSKSQNSQSHGGQRAKLAAAVLPPCVPAVSLAPVVTHAGDASGTSSRNAQVTCIVTRVRHRPSDIFVHPRQFGGTMDTRSTSSLQPAEGLQVRYSAVPSRERGQRSHGQPGNGGVRAPPLEGQVLLVEPGPLRRWIIGDDVPLDELADQLADSGLHAPKIGCTN